LKAEDLCLEVCGVRRLVYAWACYMRQPREVPHAAAEHAFDTWPPSFRRRADWRSTVGGPVERSRSC